MTEHFIQRLWSNIPFMTKLIAITTLTITLLVHLQLISPFYMSYSTFYVKKLQLWRLLTTFYYFGPATPDTFLHIFFLCRYSKMLEEGYLYTSDYAYLLIFIKALLFIFARLFGMANLGQALSTTITYIWTRKNPQMNVQFLGCILFPAFYLPFVVPLFGFLYDRRVPVDDLMGIFVGHLYFFCKSVWPRFGVDFMGTPWWMRYCFGEEYEEVKEVKVESVDDRKEKVDEKKEKVEDRKEKVEEKVEAINVNKGKVGDAIINEVVDELGKDEKNEDVKFISERTKFGKAKSLRADSDESEYVKDIKVPLFNYIEEDGKQSIGKFKEVKEVSTESESKIDVVKQIIDDVNKKFIEKGAEIKKDLIEVEKKGLKGIDILPDEKIDLSFSDEDIVIEDKNEPKNDSCNEQEKKRSEGVNRLDSTVNLEKGDNKEITFISTPKGPDVKIKESKVNFDDKEENDWSFDNSSESGWNDEFDI